MFIGGGGGGGGAAATGGTTAGPPTIGGPGGGGGAGGALIARWCVWLPERVYEKKQVRKWSYIYVVLVKIEQI